MSKSSAHSTGQLDHWDGVISDHRRRVLPWQRSQIPDFAASESLEEQMAARKQLRRLIEQGRWWYALMTPVRAWSSVWSSWLGRGLILSMLFTSYMLNAYMYVQVLQYRADTVSVDSSFGDSGWPFWLWPWYRESQVLDAVARHDAQVELHYMAKTMGWPIPRFLARVEYAEGSLPVDKCLEYEEWPKIRELKRELEFSLRLKPKVDELTERGVTVDWTFAIDPPYLNEDKLDTLLKQVEVAERMKPVADDLVQRATQIDWDLTTELKRNPYDEQQVSDLQAKLAESETLQPTVLALRSSLEELSWQQTIYPPYNSEQVTKLVQEVDDTIRLKEAMTKLFVRAEKIGWLMIDSPFKEYPYTDDNYEELKQQVKDTEKLVSNVQKLVADAKRLGWDITDVFASFPYDPETVATYQEHLRQMQELQPQIRSLRSKYKSIDARLSLSLPYTETDVNNAEEYYQRYRESHARGMKIVRQLAKRDVDGNLFTPYSDDEVEGLEDCLDASKAFEDYWSRGEDCECQYKWSDEFTEITCRQYKDGHPKVKKIIDELRREDVRFSSSSRYSNDKLAGLEQCLEQAKAKDDLARNCECTFQWNDFKELKCDYAASYECNWIKDDDLKYLCKKDCGWIKDDDLKYLCKKDCGWIKDDDLKYLCKNDCGWIKDDDLKYLCKKDCGWIKDDDLKYACKGKWYLR